MDGRGRLAQPLTRIASLGASRAPGGGPRTTQGEPARSTALGRLCSAGRCCSRPVAARSGLRPPRSSSSSRARLRHRQGRPRPAGRHAFRDALRRRRQCGRLPHRRRRAYRQPPRHPRGGPRHRRRHRHDLAVVPRCRADPRAAQDQSLDRRRHRPQAFSGRAAHHHQGARGVRALAEGWPGLGDRRRRHRGRALCGAAPSRLPLVVGRGAERRAREFLALLDRYPRTARSRARLGSGRRAAMEPAAQERPRRAAAGIRRGGGAGALVALDREKNLSRATSSRSTCGCRIG